jgi:GxxExxY protein
MRQIEIRDPQTYAIIGVAMEIHRQLGHGFLEAVYQEAAVIEFPLHKVSFEREVCLPTQYRADFVCFAEIIIEFKAISKLTNIEEAQVLNYLKATNFHRGLLINFGAPSREYKRFVWGPEKEKSLKSVQSVD